jgi:hypothetical protein
MEQITYKIHGTRSREHKNTYTGHGTRKIEHRILNVDHSQDP